MSTIDTALLAKLMFQWPFLVFVTLVTWSGLVLMAFLIARFTLWVINLFLTVNMAYEIVQEGRRQGRELRSLELCMRFRRWARLD